MSAIYVSDMQNDMEPVQVFVRIRPEHDDKGLFIDSSNSSSGKGTINNNNNNRYGSSLLPSYIELIDDKTLTIPATDENKTNIRKPSLHQINPSTMTPSSSSSSLLNTSTIIEKRKLFSFDKIFPKSCNQEDIYYQISPMVKATVRGYNTTVFAYGCTGSGKSYTMTGTNTSPGIIPRAISEIFSTIEQTAAVENNIYFYVRISYVELYNNNFRNLLDFASDSTSNTGSSSSANNNSNSSGSGSRKSNELRSSIERDNNVSISDPDGHGRVPDRIEVRESVSAGVFLAGANLRVPVTSAQEAFQLIAKGNKFRAVGATQCNDFSSRSHAILTVHVESRTSTTAIGTSSSSTTVGPSSSSSSSSELRLGKMHLIDLAGSERLSISGSEGDTMIETQNINLSLTALGDVLSALSKNATILKQHNSSSGKSPSTMPTLMPVPYRNSKLTHLLKDSLGGNSKTIMITNVRTGDEYYQQTAISLMYASRAKKVRNHSLVNRNVLGDTGIHAVTREIERLKLRLDERTAEFERLRLLQAQDSQENNVLKSRFEELKAANEREKMELETQMKQLIHSQAGEFAQETKKFSILQTGLQDELKRSHNKILEQEKEIQWLKKALDDTAQAAQQPVDQLARLQKVVDVWQQQAKNSQSELASSLTQIDILKANNIKLSDELSSAKSNIHDLSEVISDKTQHIQELKSVISTYQTSSLSEEEINVIQSENKMLKDEISQLKVISMKDEGMIKAQLIDNENLYKKLDSYKKQIDELTDNLNHLTSSHSEQTSNFEKSILSQRHQLSSLRQENQQLKEKLSSSLDTLEQSTQHTVDQISKNLNEKSIELEDIERKYNLLYQDYKQSESMNTQLMNDIDIIKSRQQEEQSSIDIQIQSKDDEIISLQQNMSDLQEQLLESKSQSKWDIAQIESDLSEKYESEIKAIHLTHDRELSSLRIEFDSQLQEAVATAIQNAYLKVEAESQSQSSAHLSELTTKHQQALESMRIDYNNQIIQLQLTIQQHCKEISELVVNKNELAQSCNTHTQRCTTLQTMIEEMKSAHKKELESIEASYIISIEESKRQLEQARSQYQYSLNAQIEGLKKQTDELVKALTKEHESKVSKLQEQLRLLELSTDHDDEIIRLQAQWKEKFEQSLRIALEEQESNLLSAFETEKSTIFDTFETEKSVLLTQTLKQLEQEFDQRVETVNYEFQLERGSMQESFMTKLANKESEFNTKLEEISAAFDNQQNQSHEEWKSSQYHLVQSLNSQHQSDLQRIYEESQAQAAIEWQEKLLQSELVWASNNESMYMNELNRQLYKHRLQWQTESQEVLSRCNKEWEDKLQSALDTLKVEVQQQYDSEKASLLIANNDKFSHQISILASRVVSLESDLSAQAVANTDKLTQLNSMWEKQLSHASDEYTIKLEAEKRALTSRLDEDHAIKLKLLETKLTQLFNTTKQQELDIQRKTLSDHFDNILSEKNTLLLSLQSELVSAQATNTRLQDMNVATQDDRVNTYEQQIRQLESAHTNKLASQSLAHESAYQLLQQELQSLQTKNSQDIEYIRSVHSQELVSLQQMNDTKITNIISENDAKYKELLATQSQSLEQEKIILQQQLEESIRNLEKEKSLFESRLQSELQTMEKYWSQLVSSSKSVEDTKSISTISDADGKLLTIAPSITLSPSVTLFHSISPIITHVEPTTELNHSIVSSISPLNQLMTSIREGDSQGIRSIIQSHGASLRSLYWKETMTNHNNSNNSNIITTKESISSHSVCLPLHSAITGLHIHGNETLLLSTLETLLQLEADVNQQDRVGDSIIHKSLQVCTSKNIISVLTLLLRMGANPNPVNVRGESPLLQECANLRSASYDIIQLLIQAGANVNISMTRSVNINSTFYNNNNSSSAGANTVNSHHNNNITSTATTATATTSHHIDTNSSNHQLTEPAYFISNDLCERSALTVLLEQGVLSTYSITELLLNRMSPRIHSTDQTTTTQLSSIHHLQPQYTLTDVFTTSSSSSFNPLLSTYDKSLYTVGSQKDINSKSKSKPRSKSHGNTPYASSRKVWINVLNLLLQSGASWSPLWRNDKNNTQLHLLLASFPPTRADILTYYSIVEKAVSAFIAIDSSNIMIMNSKGQFPLYVFCERLSFFSYDRYCDGLHDMLQLLISQSLAVSTATPKYNTSSSINNSSSMKHSQYTRNHTFLLRKQITDIPDLFPSSALSTLKPYITQIFGQSHSDALSLNRHIHISQSNTLMNANTSANISYFSLSIDSDSNSNIHQNNNIDGTTTATNISNLLQQSKQEMKRYSMSIVPTSTQSDQRPSNQIITVSSKNQKSTNLPISIPTSSTTNHTNSHINSSTQTQLGTDSMNKRAFLYKKYPIAINAYRSQPITTTTVAKATTTGTTTGITAGDISPTSSSDSQPIDRRNTSQLKHFSTAATRLSHLTSALKSKSTIINKVKNNSTNNEGDDTFDQSSLPIHVSTAFFNM